MSKHRGQVDPTIYVAAIAAVSFLGWAIGSLIYYL